jgi:hypothetical protein
MRPDREVQKNPHFEAEMRALYERAQKVVDEAFKARKKDPAAANSIYENAMDRLKNEVFRDGCLGPGTGAADPYPYFEQLGKEFGRFDSREMDLRKVSIEEFVRIAHRAAKFLGENKYGIAKMVEERPGWKGFDIKVESDPAKVARELEEWGLKWDKVYHFEISETYYDIHRCKFEIIRFQQKAIVKGRKEFVDEVMSGR